MHGTAEDNAPEGSVIDVLKTSGFDADTISAEDMWTQTSDETIGTIIAHKTTSDGKDVLAVIVRSYH